ncbi:hypothetical protein PAMA_012662 [Pampus argenteus]
MRLTFGCLVIAAGICGALSFAFLAASLGTDYWYIIEMNPMNMSDSEDISSHSGLWSINEGGKMYADSIDSFTADYSKYSETELHMLTWSSCCLEESVDWSAPWLGALLSSRAQPPTSSSAPGAPQRYTSAHSSTYGQAAAQQSLHGLTRSPHSVCNTFRMETNELNYM